MQGAFVRALGAVFHLNCFKCMVRLCFACFSVSVVYDRVSSPQDCGDVVASKFFPIEGPDVKQHPLCERDYFRRLNLICAKCGMALRGSYITACSMSNHILSTLTSSYGLSLTFSRQEVSRGALHLLDMPYSVWTARLVL